MRIGVDGMNRARMSTRIVLWAVAGWAACDGADRDRRGEGASSSASSDTMGSTTAAATADGASAGTIDASRFLGIFHGEPPFTPFGCEGHDFGSTLLVNVEIRPDGTASMIWEDCSVTRGTTEIQWRWEALADDELELLPGPGEGSLRWLAVTHLGSLRATIDDECELRFEVDGELRHVPFRPGEACWVNRCEDGKAHVDYCERPAPVCVQ